MKKYNNCIHVQGVTHRSRTPHTRRVHVRAVPVLVKLRTTPILLCVHPVSVLLKISWQYINNFPDSGVYIAQVRLHNRRVHVHILLVFLHIWCHIPLALCAYCVCLPKNMMIMCQQFIRLLFLWYRFSFALWSGGRFFQLPNCQGLPLPTFCHPDFLQCWCLRHDTAFSASV